MCGEVLVEGLAHRVVQLPQGVDVGAAADPLPVRGVNALRATPQVLSCGRVVDVDVDQLGMTAAPRTPSRRP